MNKEPHDRDGFYWVNVAMAAVVVPAVVLALIAELCEKFQ
tara:strand:- start:109 stop:228 length:120 start_codon:yes stop_codon:yes gene_type:complete